MLHTIQNIDLFLEVTKIPKNLQNVSFYLFLKTFRAIFYSLSQMIIFVNEQKIALKFLK